MLGRRLHGWSDEFNLFRINHKPRPILAAAVEIRKDRRGRSEGGYATETTRPDAKGGKDIEERIAERRAEERRRK